MISVKSGGGAARQEKTVTAGTSTIEVTPNTGRLFSKVTVNPTPTQSKTIEPIPRQQVVLPDEGYHLEEVIVEASKIDIVNGKEIRAVCLENIPVNSFVNKVAVNSEKTNIGRLWTLNAYARRLKRIKDDYYILISMYGDSFYANLMHIPINGPVTSGINVFVWTLYDGLGNVDICINDENSFVLACDGWGSYATKYYTVDYDSMTVTQKSALHGVAYVYQPGVIKIAKNRFMRNVQLTSSNVIEIIALTGDTLMKESSTTVPESENYNYVYPIYVRDNEAFLVAYDGNSNSGYISYLPVKYTSGSLVFGSYVATGSYLGSDTTVYPYSQIASANPKLFDVILTTERRAFAINVRNNVLTVLEYISLPYACDNIHPSMWLSGENTAYFNTNNILYKCGLSNSSPYITFESSNNQSASDTGCAVGYDTISGFGVMFRIGPDSVIEQMTSYTGTLDVVIPGRIENVYGVALADGLAGEEVPCIVMDI